MFEVRDTGIGITPEMLSSIFDPFVQEPVSLATTRQAWALACRSFAVWRSCTAARLPPLVPASIRGARLRFTGRWPTGCRTKLVAGRRVRLEQRIVIVEDNRDVHEMLQTLMELEGHEVAAADDGPKALELIEFRRPDIALVDIGLPSFDGYEVARRVRANPATKDVFLVALTGYGLPEDQRQAAEAGFDAHLVKPIDLDKLSRLIMDRRSPPAT